jgi:hypothetical protein
MLHFIYCYDDCRYAECRGAVPDRLFLSSLMFASTAGTTIVVHLSVAKRAATEQVNHQGQTL